MTVEFHGFIISINLDQYICSTSCMDLGIMPDNVSEYYNIFETKTIDNTLTGL